MKRYTIGTAARLSGLSSATVRNWEHRYGVVVALRSDGGQRLFSWAQIEQLRMLRGWVERGFTTAEAHALLEEELRRSLLNASAHTAFGRVLETDFTVARRRAAATRSASAAIRERTEQTKRQLSELMGELTQRTAELAALCESRSPAADAAASSRSAVAHRRMGY